ncbi:hypothetical protein M9Y10_035831 [Tritrichomonas musculus]|uniref:DUF3447 domain-containing protein n=1 Tax=Tritrichomonas musculus TaxID=1915356 RepID=A0ABR2GXA2_9EUKA
MTYVNYKEKLETVQNNILEFLDHDDNDEENLQNLNYFIEENKMNDSQDKIKTILYLLSNIVDHHHHHFPTFFDKVEMILLIFREKIIFYFTNSEIYNFFKNNKKILLFLILFNVITFDEFLYNLITKDKYKLYNFPKYFSPEIKHLISEFTEDITDTEEENNESEENEEYLNKIPNDFDENRQNGENENFLCELIREDRIDEFKAYVNDGNISLDSQIEPSLYECNLFLLQNQETTLIEYSAFFGSIQIFEYLYSKRVKLTPKIWIYAVHGDNLELILFLEQYQNDFEKVPFEECFKESIKCHHNSIAQHFRTNFMDQNEIDNKIKNDYKDNMYSYGFHFYNFSYLPRRLTNNKFIFYYACEFDYFYLVELLMNMKPMDLNFKII